MEKVVAVQGAINTTQQLGEMAVGLRKQFDVRSLVSTMVIAALDAGIGQKLVPNGETFDHCIEQRIISMTETVIGDAIMGVPIRIENILAMEGGSTLANGGLKLIQKISKYQPNHMINNKSNDPYTQAQADKKGIIKEKDLYIECS